MTELPEGLYLSPVLHHPEGLALVTDGPALPLFLGNTPVHAFEPGWTARYAYAGFRPFTILILGHDNDAAALWIVDNNGRRCAGSVDELDPPTLAAFRLAATPIVRRLLITILEHTEPQLTGPLRCFLALPLDFRNAVARTLGSLGCPPPRHVVLDKPGAAWNAGEHAPVRREHLQTLFALPFQDRLLDTTETGRLRWTSPVDGTPAETQGSLWRDDFRFAYRFITNDGTLVCYAIVSDQLSELLGVYIPSLDVIFVRDDQALHWMNVYFGDILAWFSNLFCEYGAILAPYLQRRAGELHNIMRTAPGTHMGHQLWNELAGTSTFLDKAPGTFLPQWVVAGPLEIWGPMEQIFARLAGKIDRSSPNGAAAILKSYADGACAVRITRDYVPESLRVKLIQQVARDPVSTEIDRLIRNTGRKGPILLIGLRVENRTLVDIQAFFGNLVAFIGENIPGTILVVDGHNSDPTGRSIDSHGEFLAARTPIDVEREIVAHMQARADPHGIPVFSTIGSTINTSLAWCSRANCFFSIWGASLAKYRWVCNKPGLVISSRYNLTARHDLYIYDSPRYMENPTPLTFVDADAIEDLPEAPQLVNVGPGMASFFNFHADQDRVFTQLAAVIAKAYAPTPG